MQFALESVNEWVALGRQAKRSNLDAFEEIKQTYKELRRVTEVRELVRRIFGHGLRVLPSHAALFWFLHPKITKCCVCHSPVLSFVRQNRSSPEWCTVRCKNRDERNKLYGLDNHASSPSVKSKVRSTLSKYAGGHPLRDPSVIKKLKLTCLNRYGVENPWASSVVKSKIAATNRIKYGARSYMQNPVIAERVASKAFHTKEFVILGKTHTVQGFEGSALKEIESQIKSVATRRSEMPEIWYNQSGTRRRYYPDALVVSKTGRKFILEIKSDWTFVREGARNLAKLGALRRWCRSNGCEFALYVRNTKSRLWFVNPTAQQCRRLLSQYSVGKSTVRWNTK